MIARLKPAARPGLLMMLALFLLCAPAFPQQPVRNDVKLAEIHARDPFILADKPTQTYYFYLSAGPGVDGNRNAGVAAYKSKDLKTWSGPYVVFEVPDGIWANPQERVWAPEVHFYNGKYYLFVTLHNSAEPLPAPDDKSKGFQVRVTVDGKPAAHRRGTQVFVSDSPSGPFKLLGAQPIAPADSMTLDGTFYVEDGQPYMIYAHEWVQLVDGFMETVPMRPDLSAASGAPTYLFKASDAPWLKQQTDTRSIARHYVTDGPELYRTRKGNLLMLWASYRDREYVETLAHSTSGKLAGPWQQDGILVGGDSGHGMLFTTFSGRLMLILHHTAEGQPVSDKLYEVEDTGETIRLKTGRPLPE
ncbi:MAG: glycoside hydrolase family 43 protein [Terracidiphilus sp.]|jgi:hypothetical protein